MIYNFFYNTIFYSIRKVFIPLISLFIQKVKTRMLDAKNVFDSISFIKSSDDKVIWFHAASMGEFEQAKPVIEKIKTSSKDYKIVVTFYSPSGFENQKNYPFADCILYLPDDSFRKVRSFYNKFNPDLAIFVRYDFWFNYLTEANNRNIPVYLIAATMPANFLMRALPVIKNITKLYYSKFKKIFTVGKDHTEYFKRLEISGKVITCNDPRFDRIMDIVNQSKSEPILSKDVLGFPFSLVLGSSWQKDEEIFIRALNKINENGFKVRCIFVPHEPSQDHISALSNLTNSILLSDITDETKKGTTNDYLREFLSNKHIIVDSIGKLLKLYANADAAYIGGGFGAGVHSVTEPAGYSIPLACGPKIEKSHDANELAKIGGLRIIKNSDDAFEWLDYLVANNALEKQGGFVGDYITSKLGSSDLIINEINIELFPDN